MSQLANLEAQAAASEGDIPLLKEAENTWKETCGMNNLTAWAGEPKPSVEDMVLSNYLDRVLFCDPACPESRDNASSFTSSVSGQLYVFSDDGYWYRVKANLHKAVDEFSLCNSPSQAPTPPPYFESALYGLGDEISSASRTGSGLSILVAVVFVASKLGGL